MTFEWKFSTQEDIDENWHPVMGALRNGKGIYSTTIDFLDTYLSDKAGLVDWRVVATDRAGNTSRSWIARQTVVDNVDPTVELAYVSNDTTQDTTIEPINNNQITDVSTGEAVTLYVRASDDEPNLPDNLDTKVDMVRLFLTGGPGINSRTFIGEATWKEPMGLWAFNWNTSGLTLGTYQVQAQAFDEADNCAYSQTVAVTFTGAGEAMAHVAAFSPDLLAGSDLLSYLAQGLVDRIYALTHGEKTANSVVFQYRLQGDTDWTMIGSATQTGESLASGQADTPRQDLWMATLRTAGLNVGGTYEFRAMAADMVPTKPTDGELSLRNLPGQGGVKPAEDAQILQEASAPILTATVVREGGEVRLQPSDAGLLPGLSLRLTGFDVANNNDNVGEAARTATPGTANSDGRVSVTTNEAATMPFLVAVAEDADGAVNQEIIDLDRSPSSSTTWTGELVFSDYGVATDATESAVNPTKGAILTVFATANRYDGEPQTGMKTESLIFHKTTTNLGTNGIAQVDGGSADGSCPTDAFAVQVPAGAVDSNLGLLIARTDTPATPVVEDRYIDVVGQAYRTSFYDRYFDVDNVTLAQGYLATVWIAYPEGMDPDSLSVSRWDGSTWTSGGVYNLTPMPECGLLRFQTNRLSPSIWAVTTADANAPVEVSFTPWHGGFTDQDPIIRGIARRPATGSPGYRLYIDNKLMFSSTGNYYRFPDSDFETWNLTTDGTEVAWQYWHTCSNGDAFRQADNPHHVRLEFTDADGQVVGTDREFAFNVDGTAPYIELHGGYVGDPKLTWAEGYLNPHNDTQVMVRLTDKESGVLFREDRIDDLQTNADDYCADENAEEICERYNLNCDDDEYPFGDDGFKYDVWVIDDCKSCGSDQMDIDEFEERTLIYTGTADALAPYLSPSLDDYTPDSTLTVPLAVLTGGNKIKDGSVIEITLYSQRLIMQGGEATLTADMQGALDAVRNAGGEIKFDIRGQEYVAYVRGPMDNVGNAGSRFVEQRFIVDETAPEVIPSSPGVTCGGEPAEPVAATDRYNFTASFLDKGVGVDPSTVTVQVAGPAGAAEYENADKERGKFDVTEDGISLYVINEGNPLQPGTYSVTVAGQDKLGNKFSSTCSFQVGGGVIQVVGAKVIPNPYNPTTGEDVQITFDLNKRADVEVTAYDWAGDYVATIFKGTKGIGPVNITWGGQTEDGRALANGVYLIRIVVNDGSRQEPRVLKLAIWNEK